MTSPRSLNVESFVADRFREANIPIDSLEIRDYPEESIVIVRVNKAHVASATAVASEVDVQLDKQGFDGFVTVKEAHAKPEGAEFLRRIGNLDDERVSNLINLLTARARTTEVQPSLSYVPDVRNNIVSATSPRHHLVFGRRGSGKTALLAETKRKIEERGAMSVWLNVQTYRHESAGRVFLHTCKLICEAVQRYYRKSGRSPRILLDANSIYDEVQKQLSVDEPPERALTRMIPSIQSIHRRFSESGDLSLFIFLDDFHYLDKSEQPLLLDMLHGCVRDCDAWLKVAAIQHLTRWFDSGKKLGLQSGHDAAHIDLDITLRDPLAAKQFLERVLLSYAKHSSIDLITHVFSQSGALDRLVLASGAVPRDYLTLCSNSIQQARHRQNAKQVGVQDVNKAAGDAKQKKLDELEEDAASTQGESEDAIRSLQAVRTFCIDDKNWTYFRVDFREKEDLMNEYARLQILTDLRLCHLIEPSLSDERHAGQRSEVYMLDLSQFAGQRLKRQLNVLDFVDGHLVLKHTGTTNPFKIGDTANKRLGLLRRAPLFSLRKLTP